jgi:hypothetical protein
MKLTIEDNRDGIKRYRHIQPVARLGGPPCSVRCPGTQRTCTLKRGHSGPHVAHGVFRRVLAVWDAGATASGSGGKLKRVGVGFPRGGQGKPLGALEALRHFIVRRVPSLEEVVFLVLGLAMAGFAVDWALRILGLR